MTALDAQPPLVGTAKQAAQGACAHCGLPSPPAAEGGAAFCCNACRTAHEIIHGCGLERYYELAKLSDRAAAPAEGVGASYAEFDHASFLERYALALPGGQMRIELGVRGVHCAACVWLIERLPRLLAGVLEVSVSVASARVTVTWNPQQVQLSHIARQLDRLGYRLHPMGGERRGVRAHRQMMIRVGVAGAIAGNAMLAAVALYGGVFSGIEPQFALLFRWVGLGLAALAVAWPGRVFVQSAIAALRVGVPHIDVPVALGLVVGLVAGAWNTIRNTGEVYFDTVCVLVFLLLAGRWVQQTQQRRAADALELMGSIAPSHAHRRVGGVVEDVPTDSLVMGDVVEVRASETAPVDGVVVEGPSHLDVSVLSGESRPVYVTVGDHAPAGATVLDGTLVLEAQRTGAETRIGRLMELVTNASERKAPIVRLADRIAGRFVIVVVGLALVTFVTWLFLEAGRAASVATALLIVTCPCALALATPLAVMAGIRRAARESILIKGGNTLEALAMRGGTIILDKTGTITGGQCTVAKWVGDENVKPLVGALETQSNHPIATALVRYCGPTDYRAANVTQTIGAGLRGEVDHREVRVGNVGYIEAGGRVMPTWAHDAAGAMAQSGLSPAVVEVDGEVRAVAGVGDAVRDDARDAVAGLRAMGWRVLLCSGDREEIVQGVAGEVGIEDGAALGAHAPEQKLEVVREQLRSGPVVMVGDGVNDAAALAEATVGVAVHGGAEASMHAADVYLARAGLGPLVELVDGARRTMRVIRINLGISLTYNAVYATLAVTGQITPLIAAVLMPLSSITVIGVSQSMRTFGGKAQ